MKKILKQIVKCKLTKTEMKIYGEGMIDASKENFVGNLGDHRIVVFLYLILTRIKLI